MSGIVRCPRCGAKNRLRPESQGVPRCARCQRLLPWVTAASAQSFMSETSASVPVVVDFWAPWCAPCRAVEPILERLATEHAGRLKLVKVNVDEEPSLASEWGAMSIPLLIALQNGEEVDRIVGAPPPAELERRIGAVLAPIRPATGAQA
jgi:thioredoxin 2